MSEKKAKEVASQAKDAIKSTANKVADKIPSPSSTVPPKKKSGSFA